MTKEFIENNKKPFLPLTVKYEEQSTYFFMSTIGIPGLIFTIVLLTKGINPLQLVITLFPLAILSTIVVNTGFKSKLFASSILTISTISIPVLIIYIIKLLHGNDPLLLIPNLPIEGVREKTYSYLYILFQVALVTQTIILIACYFTYYSIILYNLLRTRKIERNQHIKNFGIFEFYHNLRSACRFANKTAARNLIIDLKNMKNSVDFIAILFIIESTFNTDNPISKLYSTTTIIREFGAIHKIRILIDITRLKHIPQVEFESITTSYMNALFGFTTTVIISLVALRLITSLAHPLDVTIENTTMSFAWDSDPTLPLKPRNLAVRFIISLLDISTTPKPSTTPDIKNAEQ